MSKGISNFEINKFFEIEENQDLKNNYMEVYSIDSTTRYINFYKIIKKRNGKYPFAIFNTDKLINQVRTGGALWTFIPKRICCYLR